MGSQQIPGISGTPVVSTQPPVIRLHHSKILALFRALDSFLIIFLLWFTLRSMDLAWTNSYTALGISAVIIFGFFAEGNEVYYLWRGHSTESLA